MTQEIRQELECVADQTLNKFNQIAKTAKSELCSGPSLNIESFINLNAMTSPATLARMADINRQNQDPLKHLLSKPAIARVTIQHENSTRQTYYICRAEQGLANINLISYRTPIGHLASLFIGDIYQLPN